MKSQGRVGTDMAGQPLHGEKVMITSACGGSNHDVSLSVRGHSLLT